VAIIERAKTSMIQISKRKIICPKRLLYYL